MHSPTRTIEPARKAAREHAVRTHRTRALRLAYAVLEVCAAFVFFTVVAYHVASYDFKPLAAFCVPMLIVFVGFSSLLYNRGKSLAKGKAQVRALYAAERAMQATIWYLFGIILGSSLYGVLMYFGVTFDPHDPGPAGLWLLLFLVPYALMQAGFLYFMRAACLITPQFFGRISAFELWRRVQL
jgi:hypothetical protein